MDERGDTHALAVVRIGLGLLLAERAARALRALPPGEVFAWPLLPGWAVPPHAAQVALLILQLGLAVSIVFGLRARWAMLASALLQLYLMLADRTAYHNYKYSLLLFVGLLAFSPCDRRLAIDALKRDPIGPLWAQRLAQIQVSLMYVASGGSKLLDPDWRAGVVISDGIRRFGASAVARGVPHALVDWLQRAAVAGAFARVAIATELLLAIALWRPRWRAFALWVGLMFHLIIHVATSVAIFSYLMILIYALFANPAIEERQIINGRFLRLFDWLRRFKYEEQRGSPFTVIDRDGRASTGIAAAAAATRALPAFFPIWPALALLARAVPQKKTPKI